MFRIQNLRPDDPRREADVASFLSDYPDPGVRARPAVQVRKAIDSGLVLVAEHEEKICACSFVYKFSAPDVPQVFSEIGTMRVAHNGFGLQEFLAKLSLMQIYLEEGGVGDEANNQVFAVVAKGTASEHVLEKKSGFLDWEPPSLLRALRAQAETPFSSEKRVLQATEDATRLAFANLAELYLEGTKFNALKGGEQIEIDFGWFTPELLTQGP